MAWLQIVVQTSGDQVDSVSETFNSLGALSVTVLDAGDEPLLEPAPGETPLWSSVRLVALFPAGQDEDTLRRTLHQQLPGLSEEILVETLEDQDWSNTWRDSFSAMCFGKHLWVCPVGEMPQPSDAVVVHLDPGMAFGTGTHATTAMCLRWLDAHPPVNRQVLDYGCGSGILAIAAHKLAAAQVTAVDIDPQAILATQENARRNGCEAAITVVHPDALQAGAVDLLIANILANPLIALAEDFSGRVRPGGQVVLTGILSEQAADVQAAYQPAFDFAPPARDAEWVLLAGTRR
ncbi:MAG: 50S ribosomal protein L11 methyltransferase [Gammaproteobacteria bacterium]|nr:50S ribosomal protein L11 methyltransferase [Gammaproteobacteria bacterium]